MSSTETSPRARQRLPAPQEAPPVETLRKLNKGERVAHWVKVHLSSLEKWNQQGWRWAQIAEAIEGYIERPVTRNKLTGMVTMIRKGRLAKKVKTEKIDTDQAD